VAVANVILIQLALSKSGAGEEIRREEGEEVPTQLNPRIKDGAAIIYINQNKLVLSST